MTNIRVLIVEDKLLIAEDIAERLKKHSLDVVAICTSGEEAIEVFSDQKPDLILMDIELAGVLDGISTAHVILQQQFVPIIYLSDFTDAKTVERAKKTQPANYLAKPFNETDLIRAIDLAFSNANAKGPLDRTSKRDVCFFRDNQKFVKMALNDILYIEADRSYCTVVTTNKSYMFSSSMKNIHDQMNHPDFVRVHRSFVVNVSKITELDGNRIFVGSDKHIDMSPLYRDNLMALIKIIK